MSTYDSTAFRTQERDDGWTNVYFNGPGDGSNHGHVVQREMPDGNMEYNYVRDVEGNEYINR